MRRINFLLLFLIFPALINAQNWNFKLYDHSNSLIVSDVVNSLALDKNNQLWFGTNNGLGKFANNQWSKENSRFKETLNIGATGDTIWIGTEFQGLWSFYNNQLTNYDPNTSGIGIIGFAKGEKDTLFRLDKSGKFTKRIGNSWTPIIKYIDHGAFLFCDSHKNIWVGSGNVGLYKYFHGYTYQFKNNIATTSANYIPAYNLKCMIEDANGTLWVGTADNGLLKYAQNKWSVVQTPTNAQVFDIDIDKNNKLWLVTNKGIMSYYNNEWTIFNSSNSSLPGDWFDDILVENENKIWIATGYCGLICLTNNPTGIDSPEKINYNIYPNPTKNSIHIDFNNTYLNNVRISITNMIGKTIYSNYYKSLISHILVDLSNYPTGLYLIDIQSEKINIKDIIIKKD